MGQNPLPLQGLRILDVSTILGGPVTGTFLADFGAEVIKVEMPGRGDPTRGRAGKGPGLSYIWLQEGRNKRSITLDLHKPQAQDLLRRLAAKSDVLIENFRPGTLERWGLDPDGLLEANPKLIVFRISGFGQTGPYRQKGAFDRIASAFGGVQFVTGDPDRPPVRAGYALADYMGAYMGAFAVMMALYWRDARGGEGQVIDLALYEPVLRASETSIPQFGAEGFIRRRTGNRNPFVVPSSSFETADGKYVVIGANTDSLWERLMRAIGREDLLEDERFDSAQKRLEHPDEIYAVLEAWALARRASEVVAIMDAARVPASVVNSVEDVFNDPHVQARENIVTVEDPRFGPLSVVGVMPKLSRTPGSIRSLGPDLGQDNREVFSELLGLSEAEIDELEAQGVI